MGSLRGELTSSQIIGIVLAIAGFAVVLIFVSILYSGGNQTNAEACRLSVLARATAPTAVQANVPLKCTTNKICVSAGARSCDAFVGEQGVSLVKVSKDTLSQPVQLQQILADTMYSCWSMMGQGKLDLFGNAARYVGFSNGKSTCVICSRVAFASDISNTTIESAFSGLDTFLQGTNIPGKPISYLSAFMDRGTSTFASAKELSSVPVISGFSSPTRQTPRQIAFVFSQIKVEKTGDVLTRFGAAAAGATFVLPGQAKIGGVVALGVGALTGVINNEFARGAAAGYCGAFTSEAKDGKLRDGCSLVQSVPYNVAQINALCPASIQGNP